MALLLEIERTAKRAGPIRIWIRRLRPPPPPPLCRAPLRVETLPNIHRLASLFASTPTSRAAAGAGVKVGDAVRDDNNSEDEDDREEDGDDAAEEKEHDGGRAPARMATSSRRSTSARARGAAQAKPTRAGRRAKRDLSTVKDGEDEEDEDDEPVEQVNGAADESAEEEEEEEVLTPPVSERKGRSLAAVKRNGKEPETIEVDDEGDDEEQIEEDEEQEDDDEDEDEVYEMESILKHKITNDGFFFKIKWKGYPDEESTWEPEANILGAQMLREYWKKHPHAEKQARKAYNEKKRRGPGSPATPSGKRKARGNDAPRASRLALDEEDAGIVDGDSDDDDYSDAEEAGPKKRLRTTRTTASRASTSRRARARRSESEDESEDESKNGSELEEEEESDEAGSELETQSDIKAREDADREEWLKMDNWDGKVRVQTLEKFDENGPLLARIVSTSKRSPVAFWVPTKIANKMCPFAIIDFYETRVTFKLPWTSASLRRG
ncbi:hypothetical protein FA10DRAFT_303559 [Acaromyces ingoldii]|uniref:Chromo domain-containing protein n=1 Tax=Acaromyces ingoldii TaxID=215250 RepID=A0A316YJ20_9BASI|nr:hypothetical protein FA10DRAFT_303559 [Acaromyces ingoldii]PWN88618.1 hypothetical protein FA10DRAFT_303559 [Acaromyces ingoldii]